MSESAWIAIGLAVIGFLVWVLKLMVIYEIDHRNRRLHDRMTRVETLARETAITVQTLMGGHVYQLNPIRRRNRDEQERDEEDRDRSQE